MAKENNYGASNIIVLEGLEAVRVRPPACRGGLQVSWNTEYEASPVRVPALYERLSQILLR